MSNPMVIQALPRLKELLVEREIEQLTMAYDLYLTPVTICKIVNGSPARKSTMYDIANYLNVSVGEIFETVPRIRSKRHAPTMLIRLPKRELVALIMKLEKDIERGVIK